MKIIQSEDEFESGSFIGEVKAMYEDSPQTTSIRAIRKSMIFKI